MKELNSVYDANKKQFKENVKVTAETINKYPILKFGAGSIVINLLDKALN